MNETFQISIGKLSMLILNIVCIEAGDVHEWPSESDSQDLQWRKVEIINFHLDGSFQRMDIKL